MLAAVVIFLISIGGLFTFRQNASILTSHNISSMPSNTAESTSIASISEGKVNINTATAEDLELLPGIGEVLAQRIITYREEKGLFDDVDELLNIKGIGPNKLDAIRMYITTD